MYAPGRYRLVWISYKRTQCLTNGSCVYAHVLGASDTQCYFSCVSRLAIRTSQSKTKFANRTLLVVLTARDIPPTLRNIEGSTRLFRCCQLVDGGKGVSWVVERNLDMRAPAIADVIKTDKCSRPAVVWIWMALCLRGRRTMSQFLIKRLDVG